MRAGHCCRSPAFEVQLILSWPGSAGACAAAWLAPVSEATSVVAAEQKPATSSARAISGVRNDSMFPFCGCWLSSLRLLGVLDGGVLEEQLDVGRRSGETGAPRPFCPKGQNALGAGP